ncbi:MAG: IS3 family transposase [Bacteroidales bacterium]|nr:IS3 family transposase [Bacteroidales bacterium]
MRHMDEHHLEHPSAGVLGMQDMLRYEGIHANHKRIRRLMRLMGLEALYPKRCLSRCNYAEYIYPYLLCDRKVYAPNDVWSVDITYNPMNKGFMYLTAIIDVATRFIVGWAVSNTLEARVCI